MDCLHRAGKLLVCIPDTYLLKDRVRLSVQDLVTKNSIGCRTVGKTDKPFECVEEIKSQVVGEDGWDVSATGTPRRV
jgi:hypothetical protein